MKLDLWGAMELSGLLTGPLKKRNKSRSRSPAAERAQPAAAEGDKLTHETTPKKGVDSAKDDGCYRHCIVFVMVFLTSMVGP